jgi:gliding motility-associated-like protein
MINNSTISGGSVASWHWNFGDNTSSNQNSPTHCFHQGTFTVSLTAISDSGCVASQTLPGSILVYPKPQAGFDFTNTDMDVLDPTTGVVSSAHGASSYVYFISDGTHIVGQANFQHTFPNENPQTYTVIQFVSNTFGCKDTICKFIDVKPGFTFYIPNAFSPNGDGTNDIFKGTGIGIKTFTLMIFDRWGNLVFTSNDLEKGWDGTFSGNGKEVSLQDVFVWKVELRDDNNKIHDYDGTVSLIK